MSRFIMYGDSPCSTCRYYRMSDRCHVWRCDEPGNTKPNAIHGTLYMETPDGRNWRNRCEDYEEQECQIQSDSLIKDN